MYCAWYVVAPESSVLPRATASGSPNASRLRFVCVAPVASVVVPDHVVVLIDTSTSGQAEVVSDFVGMVDTTPSASTERTPIALVVAQVRPTKRYDVAVVRVIFVPLL